MGRLIKYLGYTFFLPFWWLQYLIPRNRNVWIFGAWYGLRYSDNSKYLFEHVIQNDPEVKAVWITKSKGVKEHLDKLGYPCYLASSLHGIYYCLLAEKVIVSSVKKDVNALCINGATSIQLWHGNPMKKIGMDDKYSDVNHFFYKVVVRHLFSMAYEFDYDYVVSNAAVFSNKMSSAFDVPLRKILETGCPRNDVFFHQEAASVNKDLRQKFPGCKLVYYLPTFRNKGQKQSLLELQSYDNEKLQQFLEDANMIFVTKAHFIAKPIAASEAITDRIVHLPDEDLVDINFLLKDADVLVTDYSGAYFDFLLTERPIIFAAFDLEDYLSESRELYFEYSEVVAGPVVDSWESLYEALVNIQENTKYRLLLANQNNIFNKYHDANNSQRVFESIKNMR